MKLSNRKLAQLQTSANGMTLVLQKLTTPFRLRITNYAKSIGVTLIDTKSNGATLVLQKLRKAEHLRITNYAKSIGVTL